MVHRKGDSYIPTLDRAIALFISQSSGQSTLFGISQFYEESALRQMLESFPSQRFLQMIGPLIPPGVGFFTPSQVGGNRRVETAGTYRENLGRVSMTMEETGNRRVETAGTYRENLGRVSMTMEETGKRVVVIVGLKLLARIERILEESL